MGEHFPFESIIDGTHDPAFGGAINIDSRLEKCSSIKDRPIRQVFSLSGFPPVIASDLGGSQRREQIYDYSGCPRPGLLEIKPLVPHDSDWGPNQRLISEGPGRCSVEISTRNLMDSEESRHCT